MLLLNATKAVVDCTFYIELSLTDINLVFVIENKI